MRFEACLSEACVGLAGLVSGRDVPYDPSWSKVYNEIDSRRLLSPECSLALKNTAFSTVSASVVRASGRFLCLKRMQRCGEIYVQYKCMRTEIVLSSSLTLQIIYECAKGEQRLN